MILTESLGRWNGHALFKQPYWSWRLMKAREILVWEADGGGDGDNDDGRDGMDSIQLVGSPA